MNNEKNNNFHKLLLDSLKNPFVFVDINHKIQYMNKIAKTYYKMGESLLGASIFDCHNKNSNKTILEIVEKMKNGLDEELITDNKKYKIYMRAVRDEDNQLIGYYERYEPPTKI